MKGLPVSAKLVASGKTKEVWQLFPDKDVAVFVSKDDITAGDGAKHDIIDGKAALANQTTCNVFGLLNKCGIPTTFVSQNDATSFTGKLCNMIPFEVIIRREAYGSYLKGYPHLLKGDVFPTLVVQLNLKTSGKKWEDIDLPEDDPLLIISDDGKGLLYEKSKPFAGQNPFAILDDFPLQGHPDLIREIDELARRTFLVLEKAWQIATGNRMRLIDLKIEFGFQCFSDRLLLADVIDSDSWRVVDIDGNHLDKQTYRDGAGLDEVLGKYQIAAELTRRFDIPEQAVIIWRGSESDNIEAATDFINDIVDVKNIVCSAHKQPLRAIKTISNLVRQCPNSVVIAFVGMSNGAGPILSAQTSVPVISVPTSLDKFHEDVWSSLRMPSYVPNLTVLGQSNAALAALQILATNNPKVYAHLRFEQEKRLSKE